VEQAPVARNGAWTPPPSRQGTVPLTVHVPPVVRQQLRLLAAEQDRNIGDLVNEGLNLLFVTYGKPELAPRDGGN
jgi:hypothetical protein